MVPGSNTGTLLRNKEAETRTTGFSKKKKKKKRVWYSCANLCVILFQGTGSQAARLLGSLLFSIGRLRFVSSYRMLLLLLSAIWTVDSSRSYITNAMNNLRR